MEKTYSKIRKIKKVGKSDVYDFTVKDTHRILANNFYTSNCDIKHPDSEDFIDAKLEQGKITGANISVRISNDFMESVINKNKFIQQYPIDSVEPQFTKEVDPNKIWNKIVHNAWKSAEPGILFWDKIKSEAIPDLYGEDWETKSTNPCVVGNTLIDVADGRGHVPIKQLAEEGNDIPVYANDNGKLVIKTMRNPRITGYKQQIYKVSIEGGHSIRVTGNHKFILKDGSIIEAKDLKGGESLNILTKWAASELDLEYVDTDPRLLKTYKKMLNNGYNAKIENNTVYVEKYCETCGNPFWIEHRKREISFCSHECSLVYINNNQKIKNNRSNSINNTYSKKGEENKQKQIKIYSDLKYNLGRNPLMKEWESSCKENNVSFRLKTKHGFKNYKEVMEQGEMYNHKVISVELDGFEDVYNGTVDDVHNFYAGGFEEKTKSGKRKWLSINQLNCGEIPLCPYDSCRLLSINLYSYVENPFTEDANFNWELFKEHIVYAQRFMDDIVDLEIEKVEAILNKIKEDKEPDNIKQIETDLWQKVKEKAVQGRRTGLGITAEGDMLAALGYKYGTKKATDFAEEIHKTIAVNSYKSSIIMAKERGSFDIWNYDIEKDAPFLNRVLNEMDDEFVQMYKETGRRNISNLTIAPNGSVSLMTKTTSGIEPVFLPSYKRRRKINPNDKETNATFVDEVGDSWVEYNVFHPKFEVWAEVNGYNIDDLKNLNETDLQEVIKKSPYFEATSNDVDWVEKVEMQGRIQKWIDHSISVTVNLPKNVSKELVNDVYKKGWESGCKGITIYRDGSRSGVLVGNDSDSKKDNKPDIFTENHAPRRPKRVKCDVVRFMNKGEKWIGFLGIIENRPYEIFTGLEDAISIPKYIESGEIIKEKGAEKDGHSRYDFYYIDNDGYKQNFKGLSRAFNKVYWNTGKAISAVLRHGMPLPNVMSFVDGLDFGDDNAITSWKAGVKRIIKKYIKDGTKIEGKKCPECGSEIVFKEGCESCIVCSYSKCG